MAEHSHDHAHSHDHDHAHGHGHSHGVVDPSITTSERGLWAIKWSFAGLAAGFHRGALPPAVTHLIAARPRHTTGGYRA
jgi:hypothetical protein